MGHFAFQYGFKKVKAKRGVNPSWQLNSTSPAQCCYLPKKAAVPPREEHTAAVGSTTALWVVSKCAIN